MDRLRIRRRTMLATVGAVGASAIAGCTDGDGDSTGTPSQTITTATKTTRTAEPTTTEPTTAEPTESTESTTTESTDTDTLYVDTEGSNDAPGTQTEPLATITEAFQRVEPGSTIHVNPGEYQEALEITASGTADAPIELTGPPDAVLRRPPDSPGIALIGGDHIHVTGLTISGLADPDRPNDPDAYGNGPLLLFTAMEFDEFNEGAVAAPHGIGHSGRQLVKFRLCANAEAGPFRVTGRAGAKWQLSDENHHNGEIVYVGTAQSTVAGIEGWDDWDRTHDVHVHHIDNSEGHPHSELVDIKPGTENVTVEYCTDGGGSQNTVDWDPNVINLAGYQCTLRWNRLRVDDGSGIAVGQTLLDTSPDDDVADRVATENEIYGNEILDVDDNWGIGFHPGSDAGQGPDDQAILCGNTVDGLTEGDPDAECPDDVPTTDVIGHKGGDSPWD